MHLWQFGLLAQTARLEITFFCNRSKCPKVQTHPLGRAIAFGMALDKNPLLRDNRLT
jgi:hypothetical protein